MRAHFPGMPIVLLLRHPCAVVASRLDLGWKDNLSETMEQKELVEDFLLPMEAEIRAAKDDFERHLFLWCIDNYVPLKQLGPQDVHLAFYENLLARPRSGTTEPVLLPGRGPRRPSLPQTGTAFPPEPEEWRPVLPWKGGVPA